ncbi:hypothetical protein GGS23DRAFT_601279 [Durotheca rogersii]|uniref:uncharacterized protein n=1 Tax=Durotheca rogersii TaxID=419775 RepID=UPI002220DB49|nr:uncharacterized protein GGS23DRAFT_601279 [Durotheca rogersii]KAI5856171.1 hypothetical protein GGS23DRAFT_601279 [Durotheca rogersii]
MSGRYGDRYSVYNARPYHSYLLSDEEEEDDEICVWKDSSGLSEIEDVDEDLAEYFRKAVIADNLKLKETRGKKGAATKQREEPREAESSDAGPEEDPAGKLTDEQAEERRQTAYALATTRRNLTRLSQCILKLECRAGKVTKEGIRQTLDATASGRNLAEREDDGTSHRDEIEQLKLLSQSALHRLLLVDQHWRKQSRAARDPQGKCPDIRIKGEPEVKDWLKVEMRTNHLTGDDACYFTLANLAEGRPFADWVAHLKTACEFEDDPADETKLVSLAWRFLDRDLRGALPPATPTKIADFVEGLEAKRDSGSFGEALKDPKRREQEDEQSWEDIKKLWSGRISH